MSQDEGTALLGESNPNAFVLELHANFDNNPASFTGGKKIDVVVHRTLMPGQDPNTFAIYYLKKTATGYDTVLVIPQTYNWETGSFEFQIDHFSNYIIKQKKSSFKDIEKYSWAKEHILSLVAKDVITGYDENSFAPQNTVTRAQLVTMLVKAMGLYNANASSNFSDPIKGLPCAPPAATRSNILGGRSFGAISSAGARASILSTKFSSSRILPDH